MSIAHSPSKTLSRHLVATPVPQAFQYCTTTLSGAQLITAKHKSHKEPLKCWGSIWCKVIQIFIPIRPTYGEFLPLKPMPLWGDGLDSFCSAFMFANSQFESVPIHFWFIWPKMYHESLCMPLWNNLRKIYRKFFIQASWGCPKHQEFRLQFLFQYENAMAYRKSILRATGP